MKAFRPPLLQKAYRSLLSLEQVDIAKVGLSRMLSATYCRPRCPREPVQQRFSRTVRKFLSTRRMNHCLSRSLTSTMSLPFRFTSSSPSPRPKCIVPILHFFSSPLWSYPSCDRSRGCFTTALDSIRFDSKFEGQGCAARLDSCLLSCLVVWVFFVGDSTPSLSDSAGRWRQAAWAANDHSVQDSLDHEVYKMIGRHGAGLVSRGVIACSSGSLYAFGIAGEPPPPLP